MSNDGEGPPGAGSQGQQNQGQESPASVLQTGHKSPQNDGSSREEYTPNERSKANNRTTLGDYLIVGLTAIIAATGIAYTLYARNQWRTMRGQLSAMNKEVTQMKTDTSTVVDGEKNIAESEMSQSQKSFNRSFGATVSQFQLEQRAWVGVERAQPSDFSPSASWMITISFVNSGRTPAQHVEASLMAMTSPVPRNGPSPEQVRMLKFQPAQSIPPSGHYNMVVSGSLVHGQPYSAAQIQGYASLISQYQLIKDGRLILYYYGVLKYEDVFGGQRQTQFCVFLADPRTKNAGFCSAFNDLN